MSIQFVLRHGILSTTHRELKPFLSWLKRGEKPIQNTLFYPNPLRKQSGYFTYDLTETAQNVRIKIFALSGRLVSEVMGSGNEGYNQILWEAPADFGQWFLSLQDRGRADRGR